MRINYLSPQGVLEVEQAALRELEQRLPSTWGAYAAFRLLTRGSKLPFDVDLLLLTPNRILVVELKNWAGNIEFSSGQWVHKGKPIPSPVNTTDVKARALKSFIREKHASMKISFIEAVVVLCHPKCRLINFPPAQRDFVMTLDEFIHSASDVNRYRKRFPDIPTGMHYRSCNPLDNRQSYNALFSDRNPAVLRRRTVLHGFEQTDDQADYEHPRKIWLEYRAEHQESRSSKALLRKWNFEELAVGGTSVVERQTIGLRELRLNETLRIQSPELHEDLLEPIGSATADDITTNFIEAYRLPSGIERLAEHLARNTKMSMGDQRSLAKSILTRFAKLHALGIAHRDITKQTLWVIEPSRIVLSSFAAARIPQAQTVGIHRVELETGSIDLPEDEGLPGNSSSTDPFTRDVFLLGVLVYEMLEGRMLERINRIPVYDGTLSLVVPVLAPWYAQSMDLDPAARYRTASESLDALNDYLAVDGGPDVCEADFDGYQTTASPMTLPQTRAISQSATKMVYESQKEGVRILVKCWINLKFDPKYSARNLRLLTFLRHARSLRQSGFDAVPEVMDFGIGIFGLMLVTRWVEGQTLTEWLATEPKGRDRAFVALGLLNAIRRLHLLGLSHGDVKADNIVVPQGLEGEELSVVLVDIPDLCADGDEGITVGTLPPALESATPQHRDAFTACTLVLQLIDDDFVNTKHDVERAVELVDALPPLDLLAETLQDELHPKPQTARIYQAALRRRGRGLQPPLDLLSNDGEFSVRVTRHAETGHLRFNVVGIKQELYIRYDPQEETVVDATVKPIEHYEYVNAYRRRNFALSAEIQVSYADEQNLDVLAGLLYQLHSSNAPHEPEEDDLASLARIDPYARLEDGAPLRSVTASELWTALANTDEMNVTTITIRLGAKQIPPESIHWLIPFDCNSGVLDFSEDEDIELLERGVDPSDGSERWFRVGRVDPDLGKDIMKVHAVNMRFSPKQGQVFHVRGTFEKVASERRVAAMKRVLAGGALIPSLVDYFDPNTKQSPKKDEHITLGDLSRYDLNESQEEALRTSISFGPIALLQGPPGTGKTKFIASFAHLLLSRNLASNILLVSQSHEAVNNVMEKVASLIRGSDLNASMVRVGLQSMVSSGLRGIQEDALRHRYRETFDAEIKERVRAVGIAMGLPQDYVQAATELHITLGTILQRIDWLNRSPTDSSRSTRESNAEHSQKLQQIFLEIAGNRFSIPTTGVYDLEKLLESKLDALAVEHGSPSPAKCMRLAKIARLSTEFAQVLRNPRSNYTAFLARCSSIVAGTCVGVGKQALGIMDVPYDWVIVDEAARSSPMELVVAMQAGKRVLLVGDHLQLPPSYPRAVEEQAASVLGVTRKDFRRINNFQRAFSSTYGQAVGRTLRIQYRMADAINRLVSHCFYDDSLDVGRSPPGDEYKLLPEFLARQVVWVDTSDHGSTGFHRSAGTHEGALLNEAEATAVVEIVRGIMESKDFLKLAVDADQKNATHEPIIGIIAMYAAQRDLIRRKLEQAEWASGLREHFTVGTVDSYQGKENRIIVLSVVRNDTGQHIGFLSDPERINVAMSRAKDRLVIVSSSAMWRTRSAAPMKRVLDEVENLVAQDAALFVSSKELKRSLSHA